jgi:hypothetical protein
MRVKFNLSCQRDVPKSCEFNGSVAVYGGRVSRNSIQMRAERSRYHQHMPVWENIMNRRIALRLIGAVAAAALLAFDSAATSQAQTLTGQQQLAFDIYKEPPMILCAVRLSVRGSAG